MKLIALFLYAVLHCISGEVDNNDDSKEIHNPPPLLLEEGEKSSKLDQFFQSVVNKVVEVNGNYLPGPKLVHFLGPFNSFRTSSGKIGNISDFRRTEKYLIDHQENKGYYTLHTAFVLDVVHYYSKYKIDHPGLSANGNVHIESHKVQLILNIRLGYGISSCYVYIRDTSVNSGEVKYSLTGYDSPEKAESVAKKLEQYTQNDGGPNVINEQYVIPIGNLILDNYVLCKDLKALLKDVTDNQ